MSLDVQTRLRSLLASAQRDIYVVRTLEFSHSAMSQVYYLWEETQPGDVTTEDGVRSFQPARFDVALAGAEGHLDQALKITLGTIDADGREVLREELDRVPIDSTEKIRCVYREYLSDDLTTIEAGPAVYQVESINHAVGVATINAVAPRLNVTRTGEIYTPRDVPMLRGFL